MSRRHHLISVLFILLIVLGFSGSIGDVSDSEVSKLFRKNFIGSNDLNGVNGPARRSLLSHTDEHETALVAALDGTIHLMDPKSMKLLWSFTSGPSIYSSYHAPLDHDNDKENSSGPVSSYFIDCGDDWNLYIHNKLGKVKLQTSIDEYLRITPHITEDGQVLLGSKETTVFMVDAKTGRLIHTYSSSDSSPSSQNNEENIAFYNRTIEEREQLGPMNLNTDELSLYITRTDYTLKYLDQDRTVLWNVTVADIGAAFICQDVENSFGLSDSGYELPSEPGSHFNMPLPCQSKAVVYRFRSHNMLENFHRHNMLPEAHHEDMMLTVSTPTHILPSQLKVDKLLEFYHKDKLLSEPAPSNLLLPLQPSVDKFMDSHHKSDSDTLVSLPSLTGNMGMSSLQDVEVPLNDNSGILSRGSSASRLMLFVAIVLGFISLYAFVPRKQGQNEKSGDINARIVHSKKKKVRKLSKNSGVADKNNSAELDAEYAHIGRDKLLLNLNHPTDGGTAGRTIGKLFVSNLEIAKGSNGTIVLEGVYEGRLVAVKRLVKAHHDFALKEIQNLIASDRHSNIVRWYGVEYDHDFVYLALERCTCSLYDLIQMSLDSTESPLYAEDPAKKIMTEYKVRLDSMKGVMQDVKLWKQNGYPSPILLKLMRDVVSGLVHLHELGIIHRDLKPQNVLIINERSLRAKLSDMGISKRLIENMSSLGHHATGYGSSGWQAPEQLLHGRQTRAVDIFSLGCVLFFCITGGRHPFGDHLERDINITKNQVDLFLVENIPEAVDLFSRLLDPNPDLRPKALEVFHHPMFWNCELRLSFLRDASDRVELEDRETNSDLLKALESIAPIALGGKWDEKMEPAFLNNIGRYRRYKFGSVRDILRVIRNKLNHYRELPLEIQEIIGTIPEGFDSYFASRFPKLLIEVYKIMHEFCSEEECFQKYFKPT